MKLNMPNFLIIGAAKAGTTSLYNYLKNHPQVYMSPVKEPRFFGLVGQKANFQGIGDDKVNKQLITDLGEYQQLFESVSNQKAIGEASTWYLYCEKAPMQINQYIPNARLIAVLRNPVDRAYSNYLHQRHRSSEETLEFGDALQQESERISQNWRPFWHYKNMGFYGNQLERYFKIFPAHQIKVYLQEDLLINPLATIKDVFNFLEIDDTFTPDINQKFNKAYRPKNSLLQKFIMRPNLMKSALKAILPNTIAKKIGTQVRTLNRNVNSAPIQSKLSPELRQQLAAEYRQDILKLQDLINRDLSQWLIQDN